MLMKYCRVHAYMRRGPHKIYYPKCSLSLREKFSREKLVLYRFDSETKGTTEFRNPKVLGL